MNQNKGREMKPSRSDFINICDKCIHNHNYHNECDACMREDYWRFESNE